MFPLSTFCPHTPFYCFSPNYSRLVPFPDSFFHIFQSTNLKLQYETHGRKHMSLQFATITSVRLELKPKRFKTFSALLKWLSRRTTSVQFTRWWPDFPTPIYYVLLFTLISVTFLHKLKWPIWSLSPSIWIRHFFKAPQPNSNSIPLQNAEFNLGFNYKNPVTCNIAGWKVPPLSSILY